jgi:hypothetical protein
MHDIVELDAIFNAPNFLMRTTPAPDPRVSIIDFVIHVTGNDKDHCRKTITNLEKDHLLFLNMYKYQFPGRGERKQHVLSHAEGVELAMILPGKRAKKFREIAASFLTRLFAGDPTLHDVIDQNALINNPMHILLEHVEEIVASVPLEECGETEAHTECKNWIVSNLNCISFAATMCPTCSTPVLGISVKGGVSAIEQTIPGTNYRADVLVRLEDNTYVSIEVAHTHLISAKKMFECKQAGHTVYEVETKEIQRAIMEQKPFSNHVLYTTCMESIVCRKCKKRKLEL